MGEIVRLSARPVLPAPSENLEITLRHIAHLNEVLRPSHAVADEAQSWLAAYERITSEKPSESIVERWLDDLGLSVSNPPSKTDIRVRAKGVAFAGSHLPACVFNADTQKEAMRTFKFWPSVSEVLALLEPFARTLEVQAEGMQRAASSRPKPAAPCPAAAPPYQIPPAPEWATTKSTKRYPREDWSSDRTHPPLRTIQEQIAIITGKIGSGE